MNYTLNIAIEKNVTRYLLCDSKQNYYSINKLLYDILFEYKISNNSKDICENLNKKRNDNFLTEDYITQSLEKAKGIILRSEFEFTESKKYIKHNATIIKEGDFHKTYKFLSLLFNKHIFLFLSFLSVVVSFIFFFKNGYTNINSLYYNLIISVSISNIMITFFLSLLIVFLHEIGHAAAAFKNNVLPKEIGVGLYFIFPVLYTNVTNVWSLPIKKRIVVNLGGIYFQLLINVFLIVLYQFGILQQIMLLLLAFNTGSILISFNPFFRYDGYWLFSDFFSISNLREKSKALVSYTINHPFKIKNYVRVSNIKYPIIIYSILNVAFWTWVYFSITLYLIQNIPKLTSFTLGKDEVTIKLLSVVFTCFLIFVWIITAIKIFYINLSKNNSHAK